MEDPVITESVGLMVDNCPFCYDLVNQDREFKASRNGFFNKICLETENFAAFPSLSPMAVGHTLIVPKYHVRSLRTILERDRSECAAFFDRVHRRAETFLGNMVAFEHGLGNGLGSGCGVAHAHLHLIPLEEALAQELESRLFASFSFSKLDSLNYQFGRGIHSDQYLMIGSPRRGFFLAEGHGFPSQFMRKLIADVRRVDKWDWKEYFGWDEFSQTQSMLMS